MGKTVKQYPRKLFRSPRGKKRAVIHKERSIPPSDWDDLSCDNQCYNPNKVAYGLLIKKKPVQKVIEHLMRKFNMDRTDAKWVVDFTKKFLF